VAMRDLQSFTPIVVGIIGTATMSIFTFVSFLLLRKPYFIVRSLALILNFGKHASSRKKPAAAFYGLAIILHYGIGIFFSYAYLFFLNNLANEFSLLVTILFGALIGIVGIAGWKLFLLYHGDPLKFQLSIYFKVIWCGHLILALTIFYQFKTLRY
jgi:hypothetical protein